MITDLALLNESGGSFPLLKQMGYGASYLVATVTVSGDKYNVASITFTSSAGMFIPTAPIFLDPQNLIVDDMHFTSGHMKLHVEHIELTLPTPEQQGSVVAICHFTDINGKGNKDFNGPLGFWLQSGPIQ